MSALAILARAGVDRHDAICPHPQALESCAIRVQGGRRGFICCPTCLEALQALIAAWHGGSIGPREIYAQMFALGYTRPDALRFLLQLLVDRMRVRLGLLNRAAL
jgi:hypothetical protein